MAVYERHDSCRDNHPPNSSLDHWFITVYNHFVELTVVTLVMATVVRGRVSKRRTLGPSEPAASVQARRQPAPAVQVFSVRCQANARGCHEPGRSRVYRHVYGHVYSPVYSPVYRHVYRHAYRHAYGHVYTRSRQPLIRLLACVEACV